MMDPKIKAKWVADLRSGKYKQGRTYLHRRLEGESESSMCCLGVLAHTNPGIAHAKECLCYDSSVSVSYGATESDTHSNVNFTIPMQKAFGLDGYIKDIGGGLRICAVLVNMNDGTIEHKSKSFKEIADFIENCKEI